MLKLLQKLFKTDKTSGEIRAIQDRLQDLEKKMKTARGKRLEELKLQYRYYELKLKRILYDKAPGGDIEYR